MLKTVVELDLKGYSGVARELEENLTVEVVSALNAQIQGFVDQGLAAIGVTRREAVIGTAGDNAVLLFDQAEQAHRFAEAVHAACKAHNAEKTASSAKRWFRIGAATGEVDRRERDGHPELAGTVIIRAVRLESAGKEGELLVDEATYAALPETLRHHYGRIKDVEVKDGILSAWRCIFVPEADEVEYTPTMAELHALLEKVHPDKLDKLIQLVEMPRDLRPSKHDNLATAISRITSWAEGHANRLGKIYEIAKEIIAEQGP